MPIHLGLKSYATLAFCRLGVAGLSPVMPGTCGTLLAVLIAPVLYFPLPFVGRLIELALLFWLGSVAATSAEKILGKTDPGEVVIDELVGVSLVLLPFADPNWKQIGAAFVLFRFFDIVKPWPVRASERWLPGGYGVMIDDVVAGLMAMACMALVTWLHLW